MYKEITEKIDELNEIFEISEDEALILLFSYKFN